MCKNKKPKLFYVVALLCIGFLSFIVLQSCITDCGKPETLAELEQPFGVVSSESPQPPRSYNVIVDASYSMYGFTGENSDLLNMINTIVARIPHDAKVNFYSFGKNSMELIGDLRSNLYKVSRRNFYTESRTDLTKPFDLIHEDNRSVNLIFTDGVQSTEHSQQDYVIFARELRRYLGDKGFFSLMGKQASFEGRYYPEKGTGSIYLDSGGTKPLYCLAFGDRKYAEFITEKIGNLFQHSFEFGTTSPNELECICNADGKVDPPGFAHQSNHDKLPFSDFILSGGVTKRLRITMKGYEERFGKTLDYTVAYQETADTTYAELDGAVGTLNVETLGESGKITYEIPFTYEDPGCYLLRLSFRKTLPTWINTWNTDDDSKPENQNKTYKLASWMNFILDNFEDYKYLSTTQYFIQINRK